MDLYLYAAIQELTSKNDDSLYHYLKPISEFVKAFQWIRVLYYFSTWGIDELQEGYSLLCINHCRNFGQPYSSCRAKSICISPARSGTPWAECSQLRARCVITSVRSLLKTALLLSRTFCAPCVVCRRSLRCYPIHVRCFIGWTVSLPDCLHDYQSKRRTDCCLGLSPRVWNNRTCLGTSGGALNTSDTALRNTHMHAWIDQVRVSRSPNFLSE